MIRSLQDFITVWEQEANNTKLLFGKLTDESIRNSGSDTHRDIGRLAWHITTTIGEMMTRTGLKVDGPAHDAPVPTSAQDIVKGYETASSSFVKALSGWNDETLDKTDEMYGDTWSRRLTLQILLLHQTHHRGQMTVLMRQAGLPLVGMYGPVKEEWATFGMTAPTI
jgi:uncharacterized damage-inducible protein DinB